MLKCLRLSGLSRDGVDRVAKVEDVNGSLVYAFFRSESKSPDRSIVEEESGETDLATVVSATMSWSGLMTGTGAGGILT